MSSSNLAVRKIQQSIARHQKGKADVIQLFPKKPTKPAWSPKDINDWKIDDYGEYTRRVRDPMIDTVLDICANSGQSMHKISQNSGVSASTLHNWKSGKTGRPQNITMRAVLNSLDVEITLTRKKK